MTKHLVGQFLIRWLVCGLGLWVAAAILGAERLSIASGWDGVAGAGFLLAVVNMAVKPLLVLVSFPAIILSMGLFMLVLNGLTILIVSWLYSSLYVKNLWAAILAGIILGLVNYLVTRVLEDLK